jgi:hypothetical protein
MMFGVNVDEYMLHGAGIFTNMCPKNHAVMKVNIPYM